MIFIINKVIYENSRRKQITDYNSMSLKRVESNCSLTPGSLFTTNPLQVRSLPQKPQNIHQKNGNDISADHVASWSGVLPGDELSFIHRVDRAPRGFR